MRRLDLGCLILLLGLGALGGRVEAEPDPAKSFFENFLKPAYFMPVFPLPGEQFGGDLTARYDQMYVPARPNLELLIVGEFPRGRYFGITAYDDHGAIVDALYDAQIEPRPGFSNPFRVGGGPQEDQIYAVRVQLGDGLVENPVPGCTLDGFDVTANTLRANLRHTAGDLYSPEVSGYTVTSDDGAVTVTHDDDPANKGVMIILRRYLEVSDGDRGKLDLVRPLVFLRDSRTGCAYDFWQLIGKPQPDPTAAIPPSEWYNFQNTMSREQIAGHDRHAKTLPISQPDGLDPGNRLALYAGPEYVLSDNPDAGYLSAGVVKNGKPQVINANGQVWRMRMRLPRLPCRQEACVLDGSEELRYWGISFVEGERTVVATISDLDVHPDPEGYVTLIISFGTALPDHVTPENGYSVVNLPARENLRLVTLRNILTAADFPCAIGNVPFKSNEHNANGGYLGEYAPFLDFPVAANLPLKAVPRVQVGSCAAP